MPPFFGMKIVSGAARAYGPISAARGPGASARIPLVDTRDCLAG